MLLPTLLSLIAWSLALPAGLALIALFAPP